MANELVNINPEAMTATVQSLPEITAWIQRNHDKGLQKGQMLLDTAEANGGLTKEMYDEIGAYIEVAKKCKTMMNEKRSPITQIMDSYRKVFTTLEADFDVNNANSIPGKLQILRNRFAAEAKRKQEEEARKANAEAMFNQALERYKQAVRIEYVKRMVDIEEIAIDRIKTTYANLDLDNCDEATNYIKNFKELLSLDDTVGKLIMESNVARPIEIPAEYNLTKVRMDVYNSAYDGVTKNYTDRIRRFKQEYLDMIPSKIAQLRLALTNEEEAKKKAEELRQHEIEQNALMQKEREEAQKKAQQEEELKAQQASAMSLFSAMEQSTQNDGVKTKTKKVIQIADKKAFLSLLNFWWINEGQNLDIEDLSKTFKKMITYAEKRANAKEPEYIRGEGISFVDEVIAK